MCLISEQATPNITPVLDPGFKPEELVMVVSPYMTERAEYIEAVLGGNSAIQGSAFAAAMARANGVRVSKLPIADAYDIRSIEKTIAGWLDAHAGMDVALNVTGGTKPMAIAAQEVFRSRSLPVFYVHQQTDQVMPLFPPSAPFKLANRVDLRTYLNAHGYQIIDTQRPDIPPSSQEITQFLIANVEAFSAQIAALNYIAQNTNDTLKSGKIATRNFEDKDFLKLLGKLESAGLLKLTGGGELHFKDEASRFFCNGGWLEEHIYAVVQNLSKEANSPIQDSVMGMKIKRGASESEIDVAFLANNRLHLIECKTKKFPADKQKNEDGVNAIYKLDSLTNLGGLNTIGMLVSYQPLRTADRQRAVDLKLKTLVGKEISDVKESLMRWVKG